VDNEQLEFLGDAILGFVTSQELFERYPSFSEGRLSKTRAHLVSARHLIKVAKQLGLGEFLRLGRGEERSGGRQKSALLVDALEALIAAIYLDGGVEPARRFVLEQVIRPELLRVEHDPDLALAASDQKSALQEFVQAYGNQQPSYHVVEEQGPDHRKIFTVELRVRRADGNSELTQRAEGPTKKRAEQKAAQLALEILKQEANRLRN
jgi:ribonuclease-3